MSTQSPSRTLTVAIDTPIAPELVEQIRAVADSVEVLYEPDLLPALRYPGDHRGVEGFTRDADGERRWQEMLQSAEVLLGLPGDSPEGLAAVVRSNPGLRWVQGTAAGTGEQVKAAGLTSEELRVTFTSANGVHVGPLAEFCLLGLLLFTKGVPRLRTDQQAHHSSWRCPATPTRSRRLRRPKRAATSTCSPSVAGARCALTSGSMSHPACRHSGTQSSAP